MANEIASACSLTAAKGGAVISGSNSLSQDMAGSDVVGSTQLVGTSAEVLDLGEISGAPKQILVKNLDAANFIELGGDSGLTVFKLVVVAGGHQLFTPAAVPVYVKADTASVRVQVYAAA